MKRLGIVFIVISLLITTLAVNISFADNGAANIVLTPEIIEEDNIIAVTANIQDNPGIAGYKFELTYNPEVFSLYDYELNSYFDDKGILSVNEEIDGKLVFVWADSKNFDDDYLFKAYFEAKSGLPDAYKFELNFEDKNISSSDLTNVPITVENINVESPTSTDAPQITASPAPTANPLMVNVQNPFKDIKHGDWFYDYVMYSYAHELFKGVTPETFSPNVKMTRAMFITVLYRLAGNKAPAPANASFSDVAVNAWYGPAVYWAQSKNLVSGTKPGVFSPEELITREQMMVIIYNFYKGEPVSYSLTFSDAALISSWAKDAVRYCVSKGIISGREDNTLAPTEGLTRAEAAKMFFIISTTLNGAAAQPNSAEAQ